MTAAHEAIDELCQAACSGIDSLAAPVVQAAADDLTWPLTRLTDPPF
jgi:hypothetical protein